jgi:hypothetical protein
MFLYEIKYSKQTVLENECLSSVTEHLIQMPASSENNALIKLGQIFNIDQKIINLINIKQV